MFFFITFFGIFNFLTVICVPIVTFYTEGYNIMFLNFFKNMKILNLDHKLHIFTSDEQGISFFKKNNLKYTLIRMPKFNNKLSEKYGSQKWNKINLLKGTIFSDLFNLYDEFIYSDPDVIWLKNGLEYLPNACKKDMFSIRFEVFRY
jgi:hypothetical protein